MSTTAATGPHEPDLPDPDLPDPPSTNAPSPTTTPAGTGIAPVPRPAWWSVGAVAAVVGAVHVGFATPRGWWFDEALMLAIGRHHLDWGSADQPPVTPVLAALMDAIAPGNVLVLRLPAILATMAAVVLAALIARELGGDARAQTLTAVAQATGVWVALAGHWLTPYTLEPAQWLLLVWLLLRWRRVRDDRLLLALGVVLGLAAQTKFQVLLLALAVLGAVAVLGPRELLQRPRLWIGAGIALVIAAPTLVWQALHGWPQLRMGPIVAAESEFLYGGRPGVVSGLLLCGGLLGTVLAGYGLVRLVRDPALRDVRYLGAAFGVLFVLFALVPGRPYYLIGCYAPLAAIGAVGLQRRREAGHRRMCWVAWPAGALSAALAVAMLPLSVSLASPAVGDPLAADTVRAYDALPHAQRDRTAVMAQSYIYAAFLDVHAAPGTLPPAHSGNRSYGYFDPPAEDVDTVLYVGDTADELRPWFAEVRPAGRAGDVPLWLATGRLLPWSQFWPSLRHLDVQ